MINKVLQTSMKNEMRTEPPVTHITSMQEVVETIQDNALEQARTKVTPSLRNMGLAELLQRNEFFDYFKYGLAKGVANVLAANDERVQAIYYFDPFLNPDAETGEYLPLDASVNLLVLVKSNSAALKSFITSLDKALTQQVAELQSPLLDTIGSILNVLLITEVDIAERRGYAALLSSMFVKPRQIWG